MGIIIFISQHSLEGQSSGIIYMSSYKQLKIPSGNAEKHWDSSLGCLQNKAEHGID